MEEILQDPARFEELLREREKPLVKPVNKFVSPIPSRQSGRLRTSERVAVAGKDGESGVTESHQPLQSWCLKTRCGSHGSLSKAKTTPSVVFRPLTDKEWIKRRNEDPVSFDDQCEQCKEGPSMYKKRSSTSS